MATPDAVKNQDSIQADLSSAKANGNARVLFLHPDAAKQAKDACTEAIAAIEQIQGDLHQLNTDACLHGFLSSEKLSSERIGKKIDGEPGSFGVALREHLDSLKDFKEALEAAGKAYENTEFAGREAFEKIPKW